MPPDSRPPSTSKGAYAPGTLVGGRFRIVALIGEGGMGAVYLAEDLTLDQQVALKFIPEHILAREDGLERFFAEVRVARQVTHPNVARVHDVGEADGQRYLSMEFVDGEDLAHLLKRIGRLPGEKAADIAQQLCAGLAAIHAQGILHRDLKPANVMLDGEGHVRITDFGLAVFAQEGQGPAAAAGTPAYMAPEQLAGLGTDERSEVFSLGLLLYELFTGKRVFSANTVEELKSQHLARTPSTPSSVVGELDPAVERTILRCLEKDPAERPPSARAVAQSLPGGDPLSAAIAAGETPAPELVAQAGEAGGLSPRMVLICLVAFFALFFTSVSFVDRLRFAMPPHPPESLVKDARDFLEEIGHDAPRRDSMHSFMTSGFVLNRIEEASDAPDRWDRLEDPEVMARRFWYRQSPLHMDLWNQFMIGPRWNDPPHVVPGMVRISMRTDGQLLSFSRVPPQYRNEGEEGEPDWAPFFEAAALDRSAAVDVKPMWSHDVHADQFYAWELPVSDERVRVRVEAASVGSRAVAFRLQHADRPEPSPPTPATGNIVPGILSVLFLLGGGVLARRNLMSGRADRRGAFRVATYCFVLLVVAWVCIANHSVATALKDMMQRASTSLFFAASVWIFYLAIEPFFRRYWPRRIVSWVRILDGRWRDPLVGRDVLVGFLIGLALANSRALFGLVPRWIGLPSPRPDRILDYPSTLALTDEPWVVAQLATIARDSVVTSLAIVTALVLLRVLLRNQKAAFAGFFVFCMLWYLEGSTGMLRTDLAMASIYASLTLVCVLRFGIVCFMASYFASQLVLDFPITLDFDAWYAGRSTMAMVLLAGLACLAARTALAGRPLFRDELSDPAAG